jgi:L-threonylcarbamoyladenylate synthase
MKVIDHLKDVDQAVRILNSGGIIVYPTETVYGIGCLARQHEAIDRIAGMKGSGAYSSYLVLVESLESCSRFCVTIPPLAEKLAQAFWPGPLTLVLEARKELHPRLTGPSGGVALRVSSDPWPGAILKKADNGLISTSANLTGYTAPSAFETLNGDIAAAVDLVINGGDLPGGVSTVLDLCTTTPVMLREGVVTPTRIEDAIGVKPITPGII